MVQYIATIPFNILTIYCDRLKTSPPIIAPSLLQYIAIPQVFAHPWVQPKTKVITWYDSLEGSIPPAKDLDNLKKYLQALANGEDTSRKRKKAASQESDKFSSTRGKYDAETWSVVPTSKVTSHCASINV